MQEILDGDQAADSNAFFALQNNAECRMGDNFGVYLARGWHQVAGDVEADDEKEVLYIGQSIAKLEGLRGRARSHNYPHHRRQNEGKYLYELIADDEIRLSTFSASLRTTLCALSFGLLSFSFGKHFEVNVIIVNVVDILRRSGQASASRRGAVR